LRDHGVDWPDPVVDADGGMSVPDVPDVSGEVMEAVFAACHHHLVDDPADLPSADAPSRPPVTGDGGRPRWSRGRCCSAGAVASLPTPRPPRTTRPRPTTGWRPRS